MRRKLFVCSLLVAGLVIPATQASAVGPGGCDYNGDGDDDLAIGVPFEDVDGVADVGAVSVIYGSSGGLTDANVQFIHRGSVGITDDPAEFDRLGQNLTCGDFNNDGEDDLAVGLWQDNVGAIVDAGSVHVIYGSGSGLSTTDEVIHQDTPGIQGTAEASDWFGRSVAAGDFDDDGFDDLVVGTSNEDFGPGVGAGTVTVIYGSSTGLGGDDQVWHQDKTGIEGTGEADDQFGHNLAVGDFDGDGVDDLAIGAKNETVGAVMFAGAVNVIYGSGSGLTATGDQAWSRNSAGIKGVAGASDAWSLGMGVGDFDGDGRDDLAVGAPFAAVDGMDDAGTLNVIYGSASGLTDVGDQEFHQNSLGIGGTAETTDYFALSLAGGDFDNDGEDDLAVAVPKEDLDVIVDAGAAMVIYGTTGSGLSTGGDQTWHQDSTGIQGAAEAGDEFGHPINTGDFNGDGRDDLVAGIPEEDRGTDVDTGAISVIYGSASGVSASDDIWDQSQLEIAEAGDEFGYSGGGYNWFI